MISKILVPSKELVEAAKAGGYAVGAFNAVNMETAEKLLNEILEYNKQYETRFV